ncbi:MAG: rod shape-determining protein RodA [Elusimicrobia bacterium]|nr:rod shape-determining protein RodA [Elusimicrobiota bacterium]MDE2511646.1 rod shape-determining protein RodA [Elusimicrobiota bacterium]
MTPMKAPSGLSGRVDWTFVAAVAGLVAAGTVAIMSAANGTIFYAAIVQKHFIALALGSLLFALTLAFNYQVFQDQSKVMYGIGLLLMIAVLAVGTASRGHRAWLRLASFSFQPAELARVLVVLTLADFLDKRARRIQDLSTVLLALGIAAPIMLLILKQPDFSTALTFLPMITAMLFCAGADLIHLLFVFGYGALTLSVPLIYTLCQVRFPGAPAGSLPALVLSTAKMGWATLATVLILGAVSALVWRVATWMRLQVKPLAFVVMPVVVSGALLTGIAINRQMKSYQRNRFVAFVAPKSDTQGASYNVIQSKVAVGSGGLWGKGLFSGTQSQLGFLPERHTDFIFATVGEEMGFMGSSFILGLYMLVLWRIVTAARLARDRYGYLVCSGLAAMYAFVMLLNIGMCVGLMPVAGIPLPLISYGGSSLVINLWSLGIVANVYARRYALL